MLKIKKHVKRSDYHYNEFKKKIIIRGRKKILHNKYMEENNNFQKIKRKKETSRYIFKDKKFKIFLKTG